MDHRKTEKYNLAAKKYIEKNYTAVYTLITSTAAINQRRKIMKKYSRIIALLIAAVTLLSAFCACGGGSGDDTTKADTVTTAPSDGNDTAKAPITTEGEKLEVEIVDYDGYDFHTITAGNVSYRDFAIENENTVVSQAQFERMARIEEDFNVLISQEKNTGANTGTEAFTKQVTSQDNIYDLGLIGAYNSATLATSKQLYDLKSMNGIDLSKSWWDQNANRDLTIHNIMFFTQGSITASNSESTFVIFFNKALAAEAQMEDPYALVEEGKWTIDKFVELCQLISEDLDGDDQMGPEDRYGLYVWDDSILGMILATGQKFATLNENSELELTLNNENTIEMFNKYTDMVYTPGVALRYQRLADYRELTKRTWTEDKALFWATCTIETAGMREMQSDFGILPYPKLTEEQDRYYSSVAPFNGQFICFPSYLEDPDRSGIITEALAYYGKEIITPAVYERQLVGTYYRDDESAAMLDIILDSYIYDLGLYFQVGSYHKGVMDLIRNGSSSFSPMFSQSQRVAERLIKKINDEYADAIEEWKN